MRYKTCQNETSTFLPRFVNETTVYVSEQLKTRRERTTSVTQNHRSWRCKALRWASAADAVPLGPSSRPLRNPKNFRMRRLTICMVGVGWSHFYESGLARAPKAREEILEEDFPVSKTRWVWWVAVSKVGVVGAPFRVGAGVFSHHRHEENMREGQGVMDAREARRPVGSRGK